MRARVTMHSTYNDAKARGRGHRGTVTTLLGQLKDGLEAEGQEAIDALKRFGNDYPPCSSLLEIKHMDVLLFPIVASHQDIKSLPHLYNSVEYYVRGLRTLEVNAESYGQLLNVDDSCKLDTGRWGVE